MRPKYETVAVPFLTIGNHQALTRKQLDDHPWLKDFVERFRHCFREDDYRQLLIYEPPE